MVDAFISYSHKDSEWVRQKLLPRLESHGFRVMIDFRDFKTGRFGVEEMQRGVVDSRHTIVVLTPAYLNSEWTTFENVMAQTLDPAATKRIIIPIMREQCEPPLRLRGIHYRDLRNDDELQWDLLIRDIMP